MKVEVEVGVHDIRSRFTPRLQRFDWLILRSFSSISTHSNFRLADWASFIKAMSTVQSKTQDTYKPRAIYAMNHGARRVWAALINYV